MLAGKHGVKDVFGVFWYEYLAWSRWFMVRLRPASAACSSMNERTCHNVASPLCLEPVDVATVEVCMGIAPKKTKQTTASIRK